MVQFSFNSQMEILNTDGRSSSFLSFFLLKHLPVSQIHDSKLVGHVTFFIRQAWCYDAIKAHRWHTCALKIIHRIKGSRCLLYGVVAFLSRSRHLVFFLHFCFVG